MRTLKRIIASLVIFVPFGFYVYAIQNAYDKTSATSAPFDKAALFLIALVAGSVTYDAAKHAILMKQKHFDQFFSKLMETWFAMFMVVLLSIASAVLLHFKNVFPLWLGATVYIIALITTAWVVTAGSAAIEVATKE